MRSRKSKTMWFAFALTVLGALFELFPYLQSLLDPRFYGVSLVVIGIIVAVLRFLTTQPLNEK
jgi:VIT1/CCC1 family predicted Fe2+/Mn2+ transporter